jgi:hypothetical protein
MLAIIEFLLVFDLQRPATFDAVLKVWLFCVFFLF